VVTDADDADCYVCGPEAMPRWARNAQEAVVLATALHPLGRPFEEPLPEGVHDYGVLVWGEPDSFTPVDPPGAGDLAVGGISQQELWQAAAAGSLLADGGRLLCSANPASPSGLPCFTEPLVRGGSVVLVADPDPGRVEATYAAERATSRV
jgi:uncharacterized protein (TIGR03089 family)